MLENQNPPLLSRGRSSALALSSPLRSSLKRNERACADLHQARTEPLADELVKKSFRETVSGAKALGIEKTCVGTGSGPRRRFAWPADCLGFRPLISSRAMWCLVECDRGPMSREQCGGERVKRNYFFGGLFTLSRRRMMLRMVSSGNSPRSGSRQARKKRGSGPPRPAPDEYPIRCPRPAQRSSTL